MKFSSLLLSYLIKHPIVGAAMACLNTAEQEAMIKKIDQLLTKSLS